MLNQWLAAKCTKFFHLQHGTFDEPQGVAFDVPAFFIWVEYCMDLVLREFAYLHKIFSWQATSSVSI